MDNLATFLAEIDRIERAIPEVHRDAQVTLLGAGYQRAVDGVPVQTGALRAEHVVTLGDPVAPQALLYEPPNRPGPDAPVPATSLLDPPSPGDAQSAAADVEPYGVLGVLNQRFYASFVHDGTSQQTPQPWMDHARDHVEKLAGALRFEDPRLR